MHIDTTSPLTTTKEQTTRLEKISLVAFLNKEQKRHLVNIGRLLKQNNSNFYQNNNLHVTIFGFGPIGIREYTLIQRKMRVLRTKKRNKLTIIFDGIRLGTKYPKDNTQNPIQGMSNRTVIAVGSLAKQYGIS